MPLRDRNSPEQSKELPRTIEIATLPLVTRNDSKLLIIGIKEGTVL